MVIPGNLGDISARLLGRGRVRRFRVIQTDRRDRSNESVLPPTLCASQPDANSGMYLALQQVMSLDCSDLSLSTHVSVGRLPARHSGNSSQADIPTGISSRDVC